MFEARYVHVRGLSYQDQIAWLEGDASLASANRGNICIELGVYSLSVDQLPNIYITGWAWEM